jgi:hypothetical protein
MPAITESVDVGPVGALVVVHVHAYIVMASFTAIRKRTGRPDGLGVRVHKLIVHTLTHTQTHT